MTSLLSNDYSNDPQALVPQRIPRRSLGDLLAEVVLRGKSAETRRAYRGDLQHFFDTMPGLRELELNLPEAIDVLRSEGEQRAQFAAALHILGRVTEADITVYVDQLVAAGYAPSTIARRLTPLRLLFSRLQRFQAIAFNPLEFVNGPKLSQLSSTLWLTKTEAQHLLEACKGPSLRDMRDHALLLLMITTGVRSKEVLGLRVEDIQKVGAHTVAFLTGKGGARERVKLQPATVSVLKTYLQRAKLVSGPIFRRVRYHPGRAMLRADLEYSLEGPLSYSGLKHILQERFEMAGLSKHLTPHSLRHTAITLALKGKATIPQVQAMARHANPSTTMRYAHDLDDLDDYASDYIRL